MRQKGRFSVLESASLFLYSDLSNFTLPDGDSGTPFQTKSVKKLLNRLCLSILESTPSFLYSDLSNFTLPDGDSGTPFQTKSVKKLLNRLCLSVLESTPPFFTPFGCLKALRVLMPLMSGTSYKPLHRAVSACTQAWFRLDGVSGAPLRTITIVKLLNTRRVRTYLTYAFSSRRLVFAEDCG
ncbi:MAG: hypothetical protein LBK25_00160 [Treponema sp.]|jgi:hypothetical protein|nr:hypothetical protein [Treponema sp.]